MVLDLLMKSFNILLSAVPMWMLPLEKGGPSCRRKVGFPSRSFSMEWYRSMLSQYFSVSGSLWGRLALMEKPVAGRLSVLV